MRPSTLGFFLLLASLTATASETHRHKHHNKKSVDYTVPVLLIGAGVLCMFKCPDPVKEETKVEKDPFTVAPKVNKEEFYILESR